jgi:hypothetical protein
MRRGAVIGLTTRRLMVVSRPEMAPASGGGEDAAARPLRLGFQRSSGGEAQCAAMGARGWSTEGLGGFGRRRERAEL